MSLHKCAIMSQKLATVGNRYMYKPTVDHTSPALCTPSTRRQGRNGPFCCCMTSFAAKALQCIVTGEVNPKTEPLPWDFVTLPEENRAADMYRQHAQKFGKDRACGSRGTCPTDRQTDAQTHRQTLLITILRRRSCGRSNK